MHSPQMENLERYPYNVVRYPTNGGMSPMTTSRFLVGLVLDVVLAGLTIYIAWRFFRRDSLR